MFIINEKSFFSQSVFNIVKFVNNNILLASKINGLIEIYKICKIDNLKLVCCIGAHNTLCQEIQIIDGEIITFSEDLITIFEWQYEKDNFHVNKLL